MLIKIKRFRDQYMTGKFTVVGGKLPLVVTLEDICDFEGEILEQVMETGFFEPATESDVENMSDDAVLFDMEDVEASQAIADMTPQRKFNPRSPKNVAIEKAIEQYGGVDEVPDNIRERLGGRLALPDSPEVANADDQAATG